MAKKHLIIIEKAGSKLWGRLKYKDNLIVDTATSVQSLQKKMRKLVKDFHGVDEIEFDTAYDLTGFFEEFNILNQSKLAAIAGINPGLMRQYASGVKFPSPEQAKKIEKAIHKLAKEMQAVSLHA